MVVEADVPLVHGLMKRRPCVGVKRSLDQVDHLPGVGGVVVLLGEVREREVDVGRPLVARLEFSVPIVWTP